MPVSQDVRGGKKEREAHRFFVGKSAHEPGHLRDPRPAEAREQRLVCNNPFTVPDG
jgi:hypothetical protein